MPILRILLLAISLCLVPCLSHAEDLFIRKPGLMGKGGMYDLQIIPVTKQDLNTSPVYYWAAFLYRKNDTQGAAKLREQALNGDMEALFALAAMSRLAEAENRPPLFGAPAAFWEDWAVRMLGEKEAWFRIGAALFICSTADHLPETRLQQMATDTLRKAARLGHPEAMFALGFLSETYPDKTFRLPDKLEFFILPQDIKEYGCQTPESRYWMGAAAANGSARATGLFGSAHLALPPILDIKKAVEFCTKAMRLGLANSATILEVIHRPDIDEPPFPEYKNCKSAIYYMTLRVKMFAGNMQDVAVSASLMMKGNNEFYPEVCLTQKEYEDTVREAEQEFERIKADMLVKKEAHDALYAKAKPMFAEMRDAFAAQAKEKAAPAEKKTAN
ncbi:hypothetical protein [uncultured Desulfovibrio sp.]|uniref:hypothetical protein n=1 Tax=uncultured Desulfovibrio sp. TaxID=167968 RepID=UPI0025D2712D|nr:hypothetical protein [uncultured Desulfovibrio sp.]